MLQQGSVQHWHDTWHGLIISPSAFPCKCAGRFLQDPNIRKAGHADDSEAEDFEMQESDFVILAARNEEDISNLEVSLPPLPACWHDGLPRGWEGHSVAPENRLSAACLSLLSCIIKQCCQRQRLSAATSAGRGSMGLRRCLAPWAAVSTYWKASLWAGMCCLACLQLGRRRPSVAAEYGHHRCDCFPYCLATVGHDSSD